MTDIEKERTLQKLSDISYMVNRFASAIRLMAMELDRSSAVSQVSLDVSDFNIQKAAREVVSILLRE